MFFHFLFLSLTFASSAPPPPLTFSAGISEGRLNSSRQVVLSHACKSGVCFLSYWWFTGDPQTGLAIVRISVDGGANVSDLIFSPAKAVGMGPFFNLSAADPSPWANKWFGMLGRDSWHSTIRVPFSSSLVMTVESGPGQPDAMLFAQARGVEAGFVEPKSMGAGLAGVIEGFTLPSSARLQLQVRENVRYAALDYMTLANVSAGLRGALFMTTLWWAAESGNTIEGCVRSFSPPGAAFNESLLLSTGWEDYYASSWGMIAGAWTEDISGTTLWASPMDRRVCAYRVHDRDPLLFNNGLRLVLRNGETFDADGRKCRLETGGTPVGAPGNTTLSVYAWFYTW
jgi:hypothetical protein